MGKPISRTCADAFMEKETYSFFPGFCFSLNTDTNFFFFFFSNMDMSLWKKKRRENTAGTQLSFYAQVVPCGTSYHLIFTEANLHKVLHTGD